MPRRDLLWKGIIENLFEHFLYFFFPNFVAEVDFSKQFIFLDKELEQLYPESESKHRYADKLVQVFLKSGEIQWVLIHVEVQGYIDPSFPKRLFQYYYRIRDRYAHPVTTLAILTEENAAYHPTHYRENFLGTEILFSFNTYKLLHVDLEDLATIDNPFAAIIEIARLALDKKSKNDKTQLNSKIKIVRKLVDRGYSKPIIQSILNFLRYYQRFEKEENFGKFEMFIAEVTNTRKSMRLEELLLQDAKERGLEQGLEQGKEKTEKRIVENALKKGLPIDFVAELTGLSIARVQEIIDEINKI